MVPDDVVTSVSTYLVTQGVLGVVCLVLLYAVWRLHMLYAMVQEKRIEEAREMSTAMVQNAHAFDTQKELLRQFMDDVRRDRREGEERRAR